MTQSIKNLLKQDTLSPEDFQRVKKYSPEFINYHWNCDTDLYVKKSKYKWNGDTSECSQYSWLRKDGHSHEDAVNIIEGKYSKEDSNIAHYINKMKGNK